MNHGALSSISRDPLDAHRFFAGRSGGGEGGAVWDWVRQNYWAPIYGFLRGTGKSHEVTEDHTQQFFEKLLTEKILEKACPEQGTLRSFLLGTLKHMLRNFGFRRKLCWHKIVSSYLNKNLKDSCCPLFFKAIREERIKRKWKDGGTLPPDEREQREVDLYGKFPYIGEVRRFQMTKTERYDGLMTEEAKAVLLQALEFTGGSMNDFMVSAAVERAERVIEKKTTRRLNREQSLVFTEALLGEREPNEAMKAAVLDYRNRN